MKIKIINDLFFVIVLDLQLFQNVKATFAACRVLVQPPWPESTLVPLQSSSVKLQYVRSTPGQIFLWSRTENEDEMLIMADDETLGLYLSDIQENPPTQFLTINKTSVNNNTVFSCRESLMSGTNLQSTKLIVYRPTLTVSESNINVQSINVSWSELSNNYQPMENYTLTVHNINESSYQTFSLNESFYVFTSMEDNASCAVFNFSVLTSFTSSIHSGNCISESNAVQTMLPSLPNITLLESSINVSLTRGEGSFIISVSFLPASTCSSMYRVTSYMLEVTEQMGIVNLKSADNLTSQITISYNELEENSKYSFRIVTFNVVGNTSTSDMEFFTTDVQSITATAQDSENSLVVQCDFITGSNAQGCMVMLVGEFENITASLTINNPCTTLTVNTTRNCYDNVIGFDIESDGSVGTLAVPGVIIRNVNITCAPQSETYSLTGIDLWLVVGIAVSVVVVIVLILTLVIITAVIYKRKRNPRGAEIEMKPNDVYGIAADCIETTPNQVYGVRSEDIETTPNEVYGVRSEDIETTPNEVYGLRTVAEQ